MIRNELKCKKHVHLPHNVLIYIIFKWVEDLLNVWKDLKEIWKHVGKQGQQRCVRGLL